MVYTSPVDANGVPAEAPWDAIKTWLAGNGAATDPFGIGGRRPPANAGPNDWDVTVRWLNAIVYDGTPHTVRANIHYSPAHLGGYVLGSIWMQGVANVSVNLMNDPGVHNADIDQIAQNNLGNVTQIPPGNVNW